MYLFSDLGSPFGNDQLEAIIDGLKEMEIHVTLMWALNFYVCIHKVKNPNWREADQLTIYKHSWEVEAVRTGFEPITYRFQIAMHSNHLAMLPPLDSLGCTVANNMQSRLINKPNFKLP